MPCCPNSLRTQFSIDTLTLCRVCELRAGGRQRSVTRPHERGDEERENGILLVLPASARTRPRGRGKAGKFPKGAQRHGGGAAEQKESQGQQEKMQRKEREGSGGEKEESKSSRNLADGVENAMPTRGDETAARHRHEAPAGLSLPTLPAPGATSPALPGSWSFSQPHRGAQKSSRGRWGWFCSQR